MGKAITIKDWETIISGTWRTAVSAIIETGLHLIKAKASMPHGSWEEWCNTRLPFGDHTARHLMRIARHAERFEGKYGTLPESWSTLHRLTLLSDRQWRVAVRRGLVHRRMQRKDAEALRVL